MTPLLLLVVAYAAYRYGKWVGRELERMAVNARLLANQRRFLDELAARQTPPLRSIETMAAEWVLRECGYTRETEDCR